MGVSKRVRRFLTVVVALTMVLSFFSTSVFAASNTDTRGHWAEMDINEWVEKGLVVGYKGGSFKPNAPITRAEFITFVNRAFQFTESSHTGFADVSTKDWYYSEILKAKAAGYIGGYQDGTIKPKNNITRQEVAAILARLLDVENSSTGTEQFKDNTNIPQWSKGVIGGIVAKGLMRGFNDGTFKPLNNTTRAEAVVILKRALEGISPAMQGKVYDHTGIYGPEEGLETVEGNVDITVSGVTLRNMVIEGDLTIAEGVGDGEVFLKGVTVKGNTYVNGGGENSIHFEDTVLLTVIVNKADGTVRIVAEGKTTVQEVTLQSSAKVEQNGTEGVAFKEVTLAESLPANSQVTLIGNFETVDIQATAIAVQIPKGAIQDLKINEKAKDNNINLAKEARIVSFVVDAVAKILGTGVIENAQGKQAKESTYETQPNKVEDSGNNSGGGGGGNNSSDDDNSSGGEDTSNEPTPPTLNSTKSTGYLWVFDTHESSDVLTMGRIESGDVIPTTIDITTASTITLNIDGTDINVDISDGTYVDEAAATHDEVADAINDDLNGKAFARIEDNILYIISSTYGIGSKVSVKNDGTLATTLKLDTGSSPTIEDGVDGDKVIVDGKEFMYKFGDYELANTVNRYSIKLEFDNETTASIAGKLRAALIANVPSIDVVVDSKDSSKLNITAKTAGSSGNSITLGKVGFTVVPSGDTLTGGFDNVTPITVISSAFTNGQEIPAKYSKNGGNSSLPVSWTAVNGVQSYILYMYDPDAGNFVHWGVTNIPKETTNIEEGKSGGFNSGIVELRNDFGEWGYGGPQPPEKHNYKVAIYALNVSTIALRVDIPVSKAEFETAVVGKVIGIGEIIGTFTPSEVVPVSSISVSGAGDATTVVNGESLQMSTVVLPVDATNKDITWIVENGTGSATISPTGLLTGTGVGSVTVVASAQDGSGVVGEKVITVTVADPEDTIAPSIERVITLDKDGDRNYEPWDNEGFTVVFSEDIALSSQTEINTYLSTISEGITLGTVSNGLLFNWTDNRTLVVDQGSDGMLFPGEEIFLLKDVVYDSNNNKPNSNLTIALPVIPVDLSKLTVDDGGITASNNAVGPNRPVKVFVKDADPLSVLPVAEFTADGNGGWTKQALADGDYDLYVEQSGKLSSKVTVTVTGADVPLLGAPITGLDVPENVLQLDRTTTSTASTAEEGAGNWTSSNPEVATIDPTTGLVTALSGGTTTISYTVSTSGKVNSKEITVYAEPIADNPTIGQVQVGEPNVIPTDFTPANVGEIIAWVSSDESKATIDITTGEITALSPGNTYISYAVIEIATGRIIVSGVTGIEVIAVAP